MYIGPQFGLNDVTPPINRRSFYALIALGLYIWTGHAVISPALSQETGAQEGIRITSATLGGECGAPLGNITWPFVQECDGKAICRYRLGKTLVDNAAVDAENCANRLAIRWRCANRTETFEEFSPKRATPPGVEAGYAMLVSCPPEAADQIKPPAATLRSVQISGRPALDRELGSVRIMRDDERVEAEIGMDLIAGDQISTGANIKVLIKYPEAAEVTLEPNTRVRISSVFVEIGTVIADVIDQFLGVFKVETAYVTAGAKGTVFRVTVDPTKEQTTVTVAKGFVDLEPKGRAWDDALLKAGETKVVTAGPEPPTEIERTPNITRAILEAAEEVKETAFCDERAGDPASNGEIIKKIGNGPNVFDARAGNDDAFIKLKNSSGRTVLSFYVKANSSAKIENIPDGIYSLSWATGRRFSRECGIFFENMSANISEDSVSMRSTQYNYAIFQLTLRTVAGGNMRSRDLPLGTFLRD